MGSASDKTHATKIKDMCVKLGLPCELRVSSAHKTTENTLETIGEVRPSFKSLSK